MPVTATIETIIAGSASSSAAFPGGTFKLPNYDRTNQYDSGTTAGQVDQLYAARIATGTTLTLTDSSLKDPLGSTLAFAHVNILQAYNSSTTAAATLSGTFLGDIFGGTPSITIPPGGTLNVVAPLAGWAVGSAHTLVVGGTLSSLDIVIAGRSV